MIKKTALEKRVKRRIAARTHRFFAVCAPGLKRLCHREMIALNQQNINLDGHQHQRADSCLSIQFKDIEVIPGGVEFTGSVEDCYAANLYLRSPSRFLMRIARFRAENFRALEKKLSEIEWELYLKPSMPVDFEVSAKASRLYHTDAIAQRAERSIKDHFASSDQNCKGEIPQPETSIGMQTIMLRTENDIFEISIDSSGELLHKRGLKENVGAAPLRETLAFAILAAMSYPTGNSSIKPDEFLSDSFPSSIYEIPPLIDGMCGSGSFTLEAAMVAHNIPAGFFRRFAFEDWPCFSRGQWNYMKKIAEDRIKYQGRAGINHQNKDRITKHPLIFAVDKDANMLAGLKQTVEKFNLTSSVQIIKDDFFDILPGELAAQKDDFSDRTNRLTVTNGFLVLNPPYGKRIGEKGEVDKMFDRIGKKLESGFTGWRVAVIVPDKRLLSYLPAIKALIPIFHGGLEIHAAIIQL